MKDNFLLKKEQQEIFNSLSNEDAGKLIKGIFSYVNGEEDQLDGYLKIIFIPIKKEIDKNEAAYKKRCEINRLNGCKGGAPKGNNNAQKNKTTKNNQTVTENNQKQHDKSYIINHKSKKEINRGMGEEKGKEKKVKYAEYVTMTNVEYEKLVNTYGEIFTKKCIEMLDNYKGSSGKVYKSDYRAILNWVVDQVLKKFNKSPSWMHSEIEANEATKEEIDNFKKLLGG